MNLRDAFQLIGKPLKLDADELMAYAEEDKVGGFHPDPALQKWSAGSVWQVEGQFIFALVRALRPKRVVEIGSWDGCSATHILEALTANEYGELVSIDIEGDAGRLIPDHLRERWTFIRGRGQDVIREQKLKAEIVFEDADHSPQSTIEILSAIRDVTRFKVLLSHDGLHPRLTAAVCGAHKQVFGIVNPILIDPSDCGFAIQVRA